MTAVLQKGSENVKITHVKIRNYRNLRNIDIGLAETVTIIGENNSGKSNFLKAITLPFLTDDNTHISKKLSWIDINNETKKCYYKKIRYLDMKEVDSGSNVVIFPLENDSYIKDYRVIDDSTVVSPLQIYLDCMQIKGRGRRNGGCGFEKGDT